VRIDKGSRRVVTSKRTEKTRFKTARVNGALDPSHSQKKVLEPHKLMVYSRYFDVNEACRDDEDPECFFFIKTNSLPCVSVKPIDIERQK
jgi:hypothetical protein